jgi:hypothetical protein
LVLATDPARQRAYLQLFLGAVAISDCEVDNPVEAREIVACLSWLARLVDQAIRWPFTQEATSRRSPRAGLRESSPMDGHPGLADLTARDESRDEPQLGS